MKVLKRSAVRRRAAKVIALITALFMLISLSSCGSRKGSSVNDQTTGMVLATWNNEVKDAFNKMMTKYGKFGEEYTEDSYAVFDFDNTCSVFDVQEQLAIYQLEHMAFAETMDPENLETTLLSGLSDTEMKRGTAYSQKDASYKGWVDDIVAAYTELYAEYGPFSPAGFTGDDVKKYKGTETWKEFAVKMRAMYDLVFEQEEGDIAYNWITHWYTGMTEGELYSMAKASHEHYMEKESEVFTWRSTKKKGTKTGIVAYDWTSGISVPDNIIEAMTCLKNNGIKVWICSSSSVEVVRSAVDVFGLHDLVEGVIGAVNKTEENKLLPEFDYETGLPYLTSGSGWKKWKSPVKVLPMGEGKVTAINNLLVKAYGHGPIAGFMDSTEDYNFCTEYKTLKVVCCVNRATRKVTDGGGVIAELAVYQADDLGYDFDKADEAGDTLYVLQGRDENDLRSFRNSRMTIRVGTEEELLFRKDATGSSYENEAEYDYMKKNKMTTEEIVEYFSRITAKSNPKNKLGFTYGFLKKDQFSGYHSIG